MLPLVYNICPELKGFEADRQISPGPGADDELRLVLSLVDPALHEHKVCDAIDDFERLELRLTQLKSPSRPVQPNAKR